MKKTSAILAAVIFTASVFLTDESSAQTPQKMNYQSVIRNSSNALVTSTAIGIKISILQNSANGAPVYVETQKPTTNANGLATIEIGSGTIVSGVFSGIDWSAGPYYLKVQTDPGGGTNYTITGTSQLLSVPYALYSASGGTLTGVTATPPLSSSGGTAPDISLSGKVPVANLPSLAGDATGTIDAVTVVKLQNKTLATTAPTNGQVLTYNSGNLQWEPQNVSSSGNSGGWSLTGNTGTTVGTNFIGTTDAQPLMFKVNNQKAGYIDYALPFNAGFGYQTLISNTSGIDNTAIGNYALNANTSGTNNTANGYAALYLNTTGTQNTANGQNALYYNSTGNFNTATGQGALQNNTTGSYNSAHGQSALLSNTTGSWNTATGQGALQNNTTGSYNSAHGQFALLSNTTGSWNTATGQGALQNNTTGNYNSADGQGALVSNTTGNNNTASGQGALQFNTVGNFNNANGQGALQSNTTGSYNSAHGQFALLSNTTGANNTATGQGALQSNTTGGSNTATGQDALISNITGNYNTASGMSALYANSTGSSNTATGTNALHANTTGDYNTATGGGSLQANTTGYQNTANGYASLLVNSTGSNNVAIGFEALYSNNSNWNTAVGNQALYNNNSGGNNTAIGYQAGFANTSGGTNLFLGQQAGYANTTGSFNCYGGYHAGNANTTGNFNTYYGYGAGLSNVTGNQNTFLGYDAGYIATGDDNTFVGYQANTNTGSSTISNSGSFGFKAIATAAQQIFLGNPVVSAIESFASFITISDGRYKKNINENVPGLSFINKLKPVTYTLDVHGLNKKLGIIEDNTLAKGSDDKEKKVYTGFIAQEVEQAANSINYNFSGLKEPQNDQSFYGLSYADFVVPLVKAVQELSVKNDTLKNQNTILAFKVSDLQNQINTLKNQNTIAMKQFDNLKTQLEAEVEAIKNSSFPPLAKK